jgi:hypothetical protein
VEVQLSRDEDKRKTWPLYLTSLRSRVGCPTALLIIAPEASVARWCAQPIELGHPGFVLHPLVAGPDAIPVLTDEQAARRDPELAVLSAMAHGHAEVGPAIAQTVLAAGVGLGAERVHLSLSSLNEAARHALGELMQSGQLEVLDARGLAVDEASRRHIQSCTDPAQLKLWLRKAVTVRPVQELLEPTSPSKPPAGQAHPSRRRAKASKTRTRR